jgi:hypothetical protein
VQGFNNIGVLHGGLLRFASKFEPAITAAAGGLPFLKLNSAFFCVAAAMFSAPPRKQ